jgi:hypothetical protein
MADTIEMQEQTVPKAPRPFHSVQVKLADEEWRRFRAITAYRKKDIGELLGQIIQEWMQEPGQRSLIGALDS